MSLIESLLALGGGLVLLVAGAEALVRGASFLALRFGISPTVVGLTVVAFGTSSPELLVSVQAALASEGGLALGNVVGSNVANLGLIVGVSAALSPLVVDRGLLRRDVPAMIGAMALLCVFLIDATVSRLEGAVLVAGIVAYTVSGVRASRRETRALHATADELPVAVQAARAATGTALAVRALLAIVGLAMLVGGSDLLVAGAVSIAERLGVSEAVIALTLVAIGTSLPELATTVVAAFRGHGEIALGGAIGSNIFNVLGVLGPAALAAPIVAPEVGGGVLGIMISMGILTAFFLASGGRTRRWEGFFLLTVYALYLWWVVA